MTTGGERPIAAGPALRPSATDSVFGEGDLFEHAFRHAPIGMALVATNGRWLKVNEALCKLVGYQREELLNKDFQSITHPSDLDSDLAEVTRLLEGAIESYELEKRYIRKDGTIVWISLSVSLVRREDGSPRFFISQIQDISRRKRAELEVERFFATSPDMLAIAGASGKLEVVSPAWERTLGWTREELTTQDLVELVHPDDRARTILEVERAYAGKSSAGFRNRCRSKVSAYHWLEWNTTLAEDGRLFCVVRDVTARMSEERRRDWLAAIVESASDAIVGVDVDGLIFSWNGGAERLYGYRAEEMLGQHISRLAPNEAAHAAIVGVWQRAIAGVKHQEYDAVRQRSSGERVDVHVQVRAVEDAQGTVIGWSVTTRDISERKRLAEQLDNQVELYGAIVRSLPKGSVTVFDRALRLVAVEGELLQLLGLAKEAIVGRHVAEVASAQSREVLQRVYRGALEGESTEYEAQRDGRTLLIRVAPLRHSGGEITGGLVLSLDITEKRQEEEQLRRAKLLLDATIENITDGIALLDPDRQLLFANSAFASMFGLAREQLVGLTRARFCALVAERFADPGHFRERMLASGPGMQTSDEFVLQVPERRVLRRALKRVGGAGEAGYLAVWRDVTKESDLLAERGREALTDVLTGITNRRGAQAELQTAVARCQRAGTPLSVALLDIDHFKQVNDLHGHAMGDVVIQAVAKALSAQARASDLVARWGGEEFIAVLPASREGALAFCERARAAVSALSFPSLGRVTISAGVATHGDASSAEELVQQADRWLYQAKSSGRDRVAG